LAIHTAYTSGSGAIPVFSCKEDADIWVPILLVDKTDGITGETGIAYGNVDVDYGLASATSLTAYSVTTDDWKEMGEGLYSLRIGASEFSTKGRYFVRVGDDTPNAGKYLFTVEVTTNDIDDVATENLNINDVPTFNAKKATDTWVPVLLIDKNDGFTGITGIAYGSVDIDYAYASATGLTAYIIASADWKEIGEGMYALRIGASEFSNAGRYFVRVVDTTPNAGKYFFTVETTDATIDDVAASSLNINDVPTFSAKRSTDTWIPVILVDKTDGTTGVTGVAYGSVDADYALASATSLTSYSVSTDDWKEIGEGMYALRIGAAEFTAAGENRYVGRVVDNAATAGKYLFSVETSSTTVADLAGSTGGSNSIPVYSAKTSTDTWVPVRLISDTDGITPITSVAYGDLNVDYALASATSLTDYGPPSTDDWKEVGEGMYALRIGAAEFTSVGRYMIRIVDDAGAALPYVTSVETFAVTKDDLVRATTPANTLDIDSGGLVDVSKFNGTAAVVENSLLSVNIASISEDNTAADTLESIIEGGTQLTVDVTKISGDATAADDLELFMETLSSGQLQTGSFVANALNETLFADDFITSAQLSTSAIAEMADAVWDEATSGHVSAGTFGEQCKTDLDAILADTGTDGVKLDLSQAMSETPAQLTVGYALYILYAHFVHKWTTSSGNSVVFNSAGSAFQTRVITSAEQIEKKTS
jgi:hypothetical protein